MPSNDRKADPETQAAPSARIRVLVADDMRWTVREVAAPSLDRRGGPHLLFESESVMRRLRFFPTDWFRLSDAQLYALTDRIRLA